jgi:hypothetical protein
VKSLAAGILAFAVVFFLLVYGNRHMQMVLLGAYIYWREGTDGFLV